MPLQEPDDLVHLEIAHEGTSLATASVRATESSVTLTVGLDGQLAHAASSSRRAGVAPGRGWRPAPATPLNP